MMNVHVKMHQYGKYDRHTDNKADKMLKFATANHEEKCTCNEILSINYGTPPNQR